MVSHRRKINSLVHEHGYFGCMTIQAMRWIVESFLGRPRSTETS
jgi:hypothetical protein